MAVEDALPAATWAPAASGHSAGHVEAAAPGIHIEEWNTGHHGKLFHIAKAVGEASLHTHELEGRGAARQPSVHRDGEVGGQWSPRPSAPEGQPHGQ